MLNQNLTKRSGSNWTDGRKNEPIKKPYNSEPTYFIEPNRAEQNRAEQNRTVVHIEPDRTGLSRIEPKRKERTIERTNWRTNQIKVNRSTRSDFSEPDLPTRRLNLSNKINEPDWSEPNWTELTPLTTKQTNIVWYYILNDLFRSNTLPFL